MSSLIEPLVCVVCGKPWEQFANECKGCGGFCTWGEAIGTQPMSWNEDGTPKAPPPEVMEKVYGQQD